ncbi:TIP41-like protein [Oppia nitens]|uniref:TIP41-like protein n=1 Tax=Oppia nitens TaxID=1686743 RepID=UPI0023DA654D|nr:TIP41-like protein [Oppia nitens]
MSATIESSDINNIHEDRYQYTSDWLISTKRSHILQSKCVSPFICDKTKTAIANTAADTVTDSLTNAGDDGHQQQPPPPPSQMDLDRLCMTCRYEQILELPHMPDMTYANNWLTLVHSSGFRLEFNCLDALRLVSRQLPAHLKVDAAAEWMKARADSEFTKVTKKVFDWTFTTDYKGTITTSSVVPTTDGHEDGGSVVVVEVVDTDERIDIEKLKSKDEILFYDEVDLFEDELADHGVAKLSVKIRVMKQSFFILMRYFLRIDNVLVRMNDTRLYHEVGTDYILREYTHRDAYVRDLDISTAVLIDPVQLSQHLPAIDIQCHKLYIKQQQHQQQTKI